MSLEKSKKKPWTIQSFGVILLRRNVCGEDGFIKPNIFWDCSECKKCSVVSKIHPTTTDYSVLVMQKRNSHAFYDIVTGRIFVSTNLQQVVDELTCTEKMRIKRWDFDKLWCSLWTYTSVKRHGSPEDKLLARDRFLKMRETYLQHIELSKTHYPLSEFGFPKGRKNGHESNLQCAIREFCEETGYDGNKILIPDQTFRITEEFVGSDGLKYMHSYYVGEIMSPEAIPKIRRDNSEVRNLGWLPIEQLQNVFRPYEKTKFEVIAELVNLVENEKSFVCISKKKPCESHLDCTSQTKADSMRNICRCQEGKRHSITCACSDQIIRVNSSTAC